MTNLEVGKIMKMKNSIITLQASKGFSILSVYGGVGFESSSMDVNYVTDSGVPVKFSLDGDNKFRTTLGARLKLLIFTINADYNMGEFNTVNMGIGLTFR